MAGELLRASVCHTSEAVSAHRWQHNALQAVARGVGPTQPRFQIFRQANPNLLKIPSFAGDRHHVRLEIRIFGQKCCLDNLGRQRAIAFVMRRKISGRVTFP